MYVGDRSLLSHSGTILLPYRACLLTVCVHA
jgi:hypothetical protein